MESTVQQAVMESPVHCADVVGRAFVHQYYQILYSSPDLVYRFYQEHSVVGRPDENGMMSTTTTMPGINAKILSLDYGNQMASIATVDSQDSYDGSVFVLVTGYLNGMEKSRKKFTQSFFLAPQDTGFYVFNDVLRYVEDEENEDVSQTLVGDAEGPLEHESSTLQENHVSEPEVTIPDDVGGEDVCNSENEVSVEKEEPLQAAPLAAPKVDDEILEDSKPVESAPKSVSAPKKSYASILNSRNVKAMKENVAPLSATNPAPMKAEQPKQEPVLVVPTPVSVAETVTSGKDVNENGSNKEVEDGYSIYIRGMPWDTTTTLVQTVFKEFGPIKANGIQVRFQRGFCFGFVEYEVASAVQRAVEASPILINGNHVVVEEKRSSYRVGGGGRGRFSGPRTFRNEGTRGRGFGGGRGHGRGDYLSGSRADFGSRNGNRGGYQKVGENGGRTNQAGLLGPVNAAVKSSALQVPATA